MGFSLRDEDLTGEGAALTYNAEKAQENSLLRSGLLLAGSNYSLNNNLEFDASGRRGFDCL